MPAPLARLALHVRLAPLSLLMLAAASQAQSPAEARADAALAQLSARYQAIWVTLSPAQRQSFSASERRWLHAVRWDEERLCGGAQPTAERAAQCRLSSVQRRLDQLDRSGALDRPAPLGQSDPLDQHAAVARVR
jgi:hypothetical protein